MPDSTVVISLGGSMVAPAGVDVTYLKQFADRLRRWLDAASAHRAVLIVGGGALAREYQNAYRSLVAAADTNQQDWIGIAATRLNAALVKALFGTLAPDEVVTDPTAAWDFTGRVLVAAGWKPGFSTDYDAVVLGERLGARRVINLSNISQVYSADPKKDPAARPLDRLTWPEFQALVGTEWNPGLNAPFDPVATRRGAELGLEVCVAAGADLDNLDRILRGQPFFGTLIGGPA